MSKLITWKLILQIAGASFIGLALCRFLDGTNEAFTYDGLGRILVLCFAVGWSGCLIVLTPLRVFFDRRIRNEVRRRFTAGEIDPTLMSPLQRQVFYANFGSLPKWLYWPFLAVLGVLVFVFAVGIIFGILSLFYLAFQKAFG